MSCCGNLFGQIRWWKIVWGLWGQAMVQRQRSSRFYRARKQTNSMASRAPNPILFALLYSMCAAYCIIALYWAYDEDKRSLVEKKYVDQNNKNNNKKKANVENQSHQQVTCFFLAVPTHGVKSSFQSVSKLSYVCWLHLMKACLGYSSKPQLH